MIFMNDRDSWMVSQLLLPVVETKVRVPTNEFSMEGQGL